MIRRRTVLPVVVLVALVSIAGCSPEPRQPAAAAPSTPGPGRRATSPSPAPASPTAVASPSPAPPRPAPAPPASTRPPRSPEPPAPAAAAPAPPAEPCAVGPQAPPPPSISASYPTALAVAPDGRLFWAERSGTVRVWQDGAPRTFATVSTVTREAGGGYSERGLLGLAVSPSFARDRFVYAFYSDADRVHQEIVRWRDCGGQGTDVTRLVELPAGPDCCHKGGRLAFGPDGTLYATLGDEHRAPAAQDTGDVRGKVLRYNADGSIPADNPFGNAVWAYGFRNPFGLAVSPSGQVAVTSNGPTGDAGSPSTGYDTLYLGVARGVGYQWPACYGYSHPIGDGSCPGGQPGPDWSSEGSTVVPTGAAFVDASGPAAYAGRLVFCTLDAGMKIVTPGRPHAALAQGPPGCRLDVTQAPDHAVFYADSGHVYREPGRS